MNEEDVPDPIAIGFMKEDLPPIRSEGRML